MKITTNQGDRPRHDCSGRKRCDPDRIVGIFQAIASERFDGSAGCIFGAAPGQLQVPMVDQAYASGLTRGIGASGGSITGLGAYVVLDAMGNGLKVVPTPAALPGALMLLSMLWWRQPHRSKPIS